MGPEGKQASNFLSWMRSRRSARRMLIAALKTEAADYVERHRHERDEEGRALVVHNGRSQGRKLTLGTGTVELKAPRVNHRRRDEHGQRQRFSSRTLPPYMRRSPKVAEVLPILYLRGLSTGDFRPALEGLLGADAAGLSPTNITRLTACWEKAYTAFRRRNLAGREYVYVWVDGVHFNIWLEDDRLCTLVMIGARSDGEKELLAVEDGYRESAENWNTLLRDLKRRGMAAPVVAVGDGALGFWAAAREVWPETREQACWCHKLGNVLDKLPQRLQPRAKRALRQQGTLGEILNRGPRVFRKADHTSGKQNLLIALSDFYPWHQSTLLPAALVLAPGNWVFHEDRRFDHSQRAHHDRCTDGLDRSCEVDGRLVHVLRCRVAKRPQRACSLARN